MCRLTLPFFAGYALISVAACVPTSGVLSASAENETRLQSANGPQIPKRLIGTAGIPSLSSLPAEVAAAVGDACRDDETGLLVPDCVAAVLSADVDCDGLTILEEISLGLDPFSPIDGPDRDCDGLPNAEDPDIDNDGIANEDDPDVDDDGIANDEDPDVDGDGVPNSADFDVDGDFLLNRWDIDDDADGTPDPEDEDEDEAPEDCDENEDDESSDDEPQRADEAAAASEGVPPSARSTVSRLKKIGSDARQSEENDCPSPSDADKHRATRQAAKAVNFEITVEEFEDYLRELEEAAENARSNSNESVQSPDEALDALIALLAQSLNDTGSDADAAAEFDDRADALQNLTGAAAADAAMLTLAEMIDALADGNSFLGVSEQVRIVAAVADQQADESIFESAADAAVLISSLENNGIDAEAAADVFVSLAAATGALTDFELLTGIVDAVAQVAGATDSPIRQSARIMELLSVRLEDQDADQLSDSTFNLLHAANQSDVSPFDVLQELDQSGANLADGLDADEAALAASVVASNQV
ncbi:MAG: hypothetical protein AB7N71_08140 [Phycisphaerae bacterium]